MCLFFEVTNFQLISDLHKKCSQHNKTIKEKIVQTSLNDFHVFLSANLNRGKFSKFFRQILATNRVVIVHWQKYTINFHARTTHIPAANFPAHR